MSNEGVFKAQSVDWSPRITDINIKRVSCDKSLPIFQLSSAREPPQKPPAGSRQLRQNYKARQYHKGNLSSGVHSISASTIAQPALRAVAETCSIRINCQFLLSSEQSLWGVQYEICFTPPSDDQSSENQSSIENTWNFPLSPWFYFITSYRHSLSSTSLPSRSLLQIQQIITPQDRDASTQKGSLLAIRLKSTKQVHILGCIVRQTQLEQQPWNSVNWAAMVNGMLEI